MLNAIIGKQFGEVSGSAIGANFEMEVFPTVTYDGEEYQFIDTAGSDEDDAGRVPTKKAIANIIQFIRNEGDIGFNLIIMVMAKGVISQSVKQNYHLFIECLTKNEIPAICVVTRCEDDEPLNNWVVANRAEFISQGMNFNHMVGTCFAQEREGRLANIFEKLTKESTEAVMKLVKDTCTHESHRIVEMADYENIREFFWQHLVNFDMEYVLLLLIVSHSPFTVYHLLLFMALFLYWHREKTTGCLDMIRLFVRFVLCYKVFFLNFITQLIEPTELYYYIFMNQMSKSLFNYYFSTGHHTLNNFNYDFSLNELIALNFTIFVAVNRKSFALVWLYIMCAALHYAITLASQLYLGRNPAFVAVEKSRGSGDTCHFSLTVPSTCLRGNKIIIQRLRFDFIITYNNETRKDEIKLRHSEHKEKTNSRWWDKYFIPFQNIGIIGNQM